MCLIAENFTIGRVLRDVHDQSDEIDGHSASTEEVNNYNDDGDTYSGDGNSEASEKDTFKFSQYLEACKEKQVETNEKGEKILPYYCVIFLFFYYFPFKRFSC